jgi:hypothetical protein
MTFLVVLGLAMAATIPAVLFIPRKRQSQFFDRVLWGATWVLAIIGADALPDWIGNDSPLNSMMIAQIRIVSIGLGAILGALSINLLLWLIDRFSAPDIDADDVEDPDADTLSTHPDHSSPSSH